MFQRSCRLSLSLSRDAYSFLRIGARQNAEGVPDCLPGHHSCGKSDAFSCQKPATVPTIPLTSPNCLAARVRKIFSRIRFHQSLFNIRIYHEVKLELNFLNLELSNNFLIVPQFEKTDMNINDLILNGKFSKNFFLY